MEIQSILTKVPKYTSVYLFGSILRSSKPNDVDVLVLYNVDKYPKATIYQQCKPLLQRLYWIMGLKIDVTCLTYEEEKQVSFINKVGAVLIEDSLVVLGRTK